MLPPMRSLPLGHVINSEPTRICVATFTILRAPSFPGSDTTIVLNASCLVASKCTVRAANPTADWNLLDWCIMGPFI